MKILTLISFVLLLCFIILSILKFGLLNSYSAYSLKWIDSMKNKQLRLWSIVTILAGMFIMPPMIEIGIGSNLQFLGFFCPLYLMFVGLTPLWELSKIEHKYHSAFAICCAIASFLWILFVANNFYVLLFNIVIFALLMIVTRRFNAIIFWGEMIMFSSSYMTLFNLL